MSDSEDEILLSSSATKYYILEIEQKRRKLCAHPINNERYVFGEFHHLYKDLRQHPTKFAEYMRMKISTFDYLLSKIEDSLHKRWRNCHGRPILQEERLMITIR